MSSMEEFDHLKIQLKDVILATNTFAPNKRIGGGGFGSVYKGELSRPEGLVTVACKRSDPQFGQGHVEFLKEIQMLSKYKHENLVSLLHFCIEGDERILVYQYASRGSLDSYLSDPSLTWTQRLKICVGAARALKYLHDPADTHQRILHRDIKSSNILLDEEWNAKVSDFGLSKIGPANQTQTYVVSNAVGTPGYCDPLYVETGILTKESDVYSFGVVLFEVMCGTLCYEYRDGSFHSILVPTWKKCYEEKRLDDIICHGLQKYMEPASLTTFSTIAYQCLNRAREERPTMGEIVQKLEMALEEQEVFQDINKRMNYDDMRRIADRAVCRVPYVTQSQLRVLFMKGILVDNGQTWFSVNKNGQHCELISPQKCISASDDTLFIAPNEKLISRFQYLFKYEMRLIQDLRLKFRTQFLSPNVTYIINLVYGSTGNTYRKRIPLKYKLEEMIEYSTSCIAHVGEDRLQRTELFQFTSTRQEHNFDIQFSSEMYENHDMTVFIGGIEFCPVDSENEEKNVDTQPITYSDSDWERKLLDGCIKNLKYLSKDIDESMTRKEVYFLLRKGIYIDNVRELSEDIKKCVTMKEVYFLLGTGISIKWFSISKNLKKRVILPAREILLQNSWISEYHSSKEQWAWKAMPGSRFEVVAESCGGYYLTISFRIKQQLLSPDTEYACYLVFKLPENASMFKGIVKTCFEVDYRTIRDRPPPIERHIYLVTPPHTPVIEVSPGARQPYSRTLKIKGHPKLRKDGWMEIQVHSFYTFDGPVNKVLGEDGYLESLKGWKFTGLLVRGIELRPAKFKN